MREVWRELAWAHQEGTQSRVPHIQNAAINLRLDQLGLPLPEGFEDTEWARLTRPILARQRELSRRLSSRWWARIGRVSLADSVSSNPSGRGSPSWARRRLMAAFWMWGTRDCVPS